MSPLLGLNNTWILPTSRWSWGGLATSLPLLLLLHGGSAPSTPMGAAASAVPAPCPCCPSPPSSSSSSSLANRRWRAGCCCCCRRALPPCPPTGCSPALCLRKSSSCATLSFRPSWLKWMARCLTAPAAAAAGWGAVCVGEGSRAGPSWVRQPDPHLSPLPPPGSPPPSTTQAARTQVQRVFPPKRGQAVVAVARAPRVDASIPGAYERVVRWGVLRERRAGKRHQRHAGRCPPRMPPPPPPRRLTRAPPAPPASAESDPPLACTPRQGAARPPRCGRRGGACGAGGVGARGCTPTLPWWLAATTPAPVLARCWSPTWCAHPPPLASPHLTISAARYPHSSA